MCHIGSCCRTLLVCGSKVSPYTACLVCLSLEQEAPDSKTLSVDNKIRLGVTKWPGLTGNGG